MGNVQAAGSPPPQFAAPDPTPPPPSGFTETPSKSEQNPLLETIQHPGVLEDLHKRTKDVFPSSFEGIKLVVNKGLSNHFQVSHSITMSSVNPSGYKFGATYVGTQQTGPSEAYPILLGDIDPSGNMNANIIHQIGERLKFKFGGQFLRDKSNSSAAQLTTEYKGDKYSAALTVANPDILNDSGLLVGHFLRAITPKVSLGAELAYQFGPQVPGREIALFSLAGRYNGVDTAFSGTVGLHVVHLCFYQKASEQLQLGCELETNLRLGDSIARIGYQIDLPKIDLQFRGTVDSNWKIAGVLEKKLLPLPFTLSLSGAFSHSNQNLVLGCGFIIG